LTQSTRLFADQAEGGPHHLLRPGEFCWADSGYPAQSWLVIPFEDSRTSGKTVQAQRARRFNRTLSSIRIRSEHTIGALKGRFQCLKGLRLSLDTPKDIQRATLWVHGCFTLHAFAMDDELERGTEDLQQAQEGWLFEVEQRRQHNEANAAHGEAERGRGARAHELAAARAFRDGLASDLEAYLRSQ
jgi:hypothetical protein